MKPLLVLLSFFALVGAASTQSFLDGRGSRIGVETTETRRVFACDLNGSGRQSVVRQASQSSFGNPSTIFLNQGEGRFRGAHFPNIVDLVDLDRDGDVDLVHAGGLAENDGTGRFTSRRPTVFVNNPHAFHRADHGDFNGDGRPDLVIGAHVHLATGDFTFAQPYLLPGGPPIERALPAVADLDRDGDLDVLVAVRGDVARLYFNDGSGTFTDVTATRLPLGMNDVQTLVLTDLDGDGDAEVLFSSNGNPFSLLNNAGTFSPGPWLFPVLPTAVLSMAAGDVNGDGAVDVVVGRVSGGDVLLNFNRLFTRVPTAWFAGSDHVHHVVLADLDGDRDLDLVVGRRSTDDALAPIVDPGAEDDVLLNDGLGRFAADRVQPTSPPVPETGDAVVADWNGDGLPDLLTSVESGTLQLGDGLGGFGPVAGLNWPASLGQLHPGDLDGDGDLDAIQVEPNEIRVLENPGDGRLRLASRRALGVSGSPRGSAVGDFDGNGTLDLIVAVVVPGPVPQSGLDQIWLGDGALGFRQLASNSTSGGTSLAAGDIDGDGDVDFVTSVAVFENQGVAGPPRFVTRAYPTSGGGDDRVQLADVDGDGALDIVAANTCSHSSCSGAGHPNAVHFNDGSGSFPAGLRHFFFATQYAPNHAAVVADLDGDGDQDLYFGGLVRGTQSPIGYLFFQDAPRTFRTERVEGSIEDTLEVFAADLDRDGDLDLVEINSDRGRARTPRLKILLNTRVQLFVPARPRIAAAFDLDLYGVSGGGFLILSAQTADIPTPLGRLGIDLGAAVVADRLPAGPERQTTRLRVPNAPALIGSRLWFQALCQRGPEVRWSNALSAVILGN